MKAKRLALGLAGVAVAASVYLLNSEEPPPAAAVDGLKVSDFVLSVAPEASVSKETYAHMQAGSLHVEKIEYFHESGPVPTPIFNRTDDGTVQVHVWVTRPRIRLIGTKCLYARTLQFAIPKPVIIGGKQIVLVNHNVESSEVLADGKSLERLLREQERPISPSIQRTNIASVNKGCGA